jgi:hypothetical protein
MDRSALAHARAAYVTINFWMPSHDRLPIESIFLLVRRGMVLPAVVP